MDREKALEVAENIVTELIDLELNLETIPIDDLGEKTLHCIIADIIEVTMEDRYAKRPDLDEYQTNEDFNYN